MHTLFFYDERKNSDMTDEQAQSAVLQAIPILATLDLDEADTVVRLMTLGHSAALVAADPRH